MSEQKQDPRQTTRRQFIKTSVFTALAAVPVLSFGSNVFAVKSDSTKEGPLPTGTTAVPETDPVASAIGYKRNVKDIDFTKYPQRKKAEAKNQFCKNCTLFVPVNDSWGKCQMLTSGLVSSHGWCGSYSKKS